MHNEPMANKFRAWLRAIATIGMVLGIFVLAKAIVKENTEPKQKAVKTTVLTTDPGVWILQENGEYQRHNMLPPGNCGEDADDPCYVQKNSSSSIPETFNANELGNYEFDATSSSSGPYLTTP